MLAHKVETQPCFNPPPVRKPEETSTGRSFPARGTGFNPPPVRKPEETRDGGYVNYVHAVSIRPQFANRRKQSPHTRTAGTVRFQSAPSSQTGGNTRLCQL